MNADSELVHFHCEGGREDGSKHDGVASEESADGALVSAGLR